METIETIFENYKAAHNEETEMTEGQRAKLEALNKFLGNLTPEEKESSFDEWQTFFDDAIAYARESEKSGFLIGFKMAVNVMRECAL